MQCPWEQELSGILKGEGNLAVTKNLFGRVLLIVSTHHFGHQSHVCRCLVTPYPALLHLRFFPHVHELELEPLLEHEGGGGG